MKTISICISTYKRITLQQTLASLNELTCPPNYQIEICIVDNDAESSAEKIVSDFSSISQYTVLYIVEAQKGLTYARNSSVKLASGEWLAFIDDDETAEVDWICSLLNAAKTYNADAVLGRVITIYPSSSPSWIVAGNLFGKPLPVTGTEMTTGSTANALVRKESLPNTVEPFDLQYNLTGGEDSDLFHRMYLSGKKIITSREAVVSETVEVNRLNLSFLLKKARRIGATYQSIYIDRKPTLTKCLYLIRFVSQWLLAALIAQFVRPFSIILYVRMKIKSESNKGKVLKALNGVNVYLYSHKED